jgi:hypothetical protein
MAKYRKKPVVIEATQFNGQREIEGMCFCGNPQFPHVHTLEGSMRVDHGDWIITGVKGEHYPCKPDIFKQTYEKVEK